MKQVTTGDLLIWEIWRNKKIRKIIWDIFQNFFCYIFFSFIVVFCPAVTRKKNFEKKQVIGKEVAEIKTVSLAKNP